MTVADLVIEDLTVEEKLKLIEKLCESLDGADVGLTPAQMAELDRRLDASEDGSDPAEPWDVVEARIRKRLG
ncbi:MAG TPA: addiction module protein [Caulobacteraceae bacterium]|nr:addiction module protein [Caulobacteraceae bacterium]